MPIVRACLEAGCPSPATGRGRCDEHRKLKERDRSRARREDARERSRFYARRRWMLTARKKKFETPICEHCDNRLATEVHHDPPLRVLIATGRDPYAFEYLVSLCHACHSVQTRREQGKEPPCVGGKPPQRGLKPDRTQGISRLHPQAPWVLPQ